MPTVESCPFCLDNNLLKSEIITQTSGGFVVPALGSEGNFLIVPKNHVEEMTSLPDDWQRHVNQLFDKVPIDKSNYNLSLNVGPEAGQTLRHLHFWVIPRIGGLAASGMGLAALLSERAEE